MGDFRLEQGLESTDRVSDPRALTPKQGVESASASSDP